MSGHQVVHVRDHQAVDARRAPASQAMAVVDRRPPLVALAAESPHLPAAARRHAAGRQAPVKRGVPRGRQSGVNDRKSSKVQPRSPTYIGDAYHRASPIRVAPYINFNGTLQEWSSAKLCKLGNKVFFVIPFRSR